MKTCQIAPGVLLTWGLFVSLSLSACAVGLPPADSPIPATSPATSPAGAPAVDATTLNGKVIFGYEGWFACPGDVPNFDPYGPSSTALRSPRTSTSTSGRTSRTCPRLPPAQQTCFGLMAVRCRRSPITTRRG